VRRSLEKKYTYDKSIIEKLKNQGRDLKKRIRTAK
jgi:ribosomal protein S19